MKIGTISKYWLHPHDCDIFEDPRVYRFANLYLCLLGSFLYLLNANTW